MCGIVGVLHLDETGVDRKLLARILRQIRYRGPDAGGVHVEGPVGLGHARLSIIDIAGGAQPMHNNDGSLWVTFNGEIFNYVELREMLLAKGHRFATQSDTEVILHLYEEYGEECVQHFNGQWAFALWDKRRRVLFLSRDRLGIRPLFYTTSGRKFIFASEIKSVLAHPDVAREIDPRGLNQVFTFWSTLPGRTVFRGISELPPGHNLIVRQGKIRLEQYWQLDYPGDLDALAEDECADRLYDLLADATRLRLRSDVPVGAYLSGGLDSAVTTALIRQCSNAPLKTFSITFDEAEFDESRYQERVVNVLRTEHQAIRCRWEDIGRVFPEVIWHTEQPILRTAPVPLYMLSKLVHGDGYKVVLSGEGADEMLGGYDIFKEAKVRRFCAARPDSAFRAALLGKLYPYLPKVQAQSAAYRKAFFHFRPEDTAGAFFSHLPRWELTSRLKAFFSPDFHALLDGHDPYADCRAMLPKGYEGWRHFCQAQYLESALLLPGYILSSQGDRVAMAHSVEGRYPFLDHRLVEFAARIHPRMKMRAMEEKYILKRAAARLLPEEVVRRTKQPYRAPDAKSFFGDGSRPLQHDYVDELLSPERIRRDGIFKADAVERLVQKIRAGRAIGVKDNMALVGILSTQLVVEKFVRDSFPKSLSPVTTLSEGAEAAPAVAPLSLPPETTSTPWSICTHEQT